jgi:hypothetical protein
MLWEYLIGRPPFDHGQDDVAVSLMNLTFVKEFIHSHLAKDLEYPTDINTSIPLFFSELIMKLGSKSPDLRYQSASGLRYDLTTCINYIEQYKSNTEMNTRWLDNTVLCDVMQSFHLELGSNDLSGKLEVYNDTVGREDEYRLLLESCMRISSGESMQEICIISGKFGIGKSSLVNMLHQHISDENHIFGMFSKNAYPKVSGMYDGNSKCRKYVGILEALSNLINKFLALGHEEYTCWSEKFFSMGHENLAILSELLPDICILTGMAPPKYLADSGASVSIKSFTTAVITLLTIVSQSDIILCIYLDCIEVFMTKLSNHIIVG